MRVLNYLEDIPENSRICLYGASDYGIALYNLIQRDRLDLEVVCFIDTYQKGKKCGIDILGPDELQDIRSEYDFIIITTHGYTSEIARILEARDITNFYAINPIFNSRDIAVSNGSGAKKSDCSDVLYAFYDLGVSPPGFEIVNFLFMAELERLERGCRALHPVIVPYPADMVISEPLEGIPQRLKEPKRDRWWLRNILVPCCWMLPSCIHQLTVCASRREAALLYDNLATHYYPVDYTVGHPTEGYLSILTPQGMQSIRSAAKTPSLSATEEGLDFVTQWISQNALDREIVTITLRESPRDPSRNSDLETWTRFARELDSSGYLPVFVRDTTAALNDPPCELLNGFLIFPEIPWNLELRMALYQLSYINLFVANGPAIFCMLNDKTRCLIFEDPQQTESFNSSDGEYDALGFSFGSQFASATPFQKLVWASDEPETIRKEFKELCRTIESGNLNETILAGVIS